LFDLAAVTIVAVLVTNAFALPVGAISCAQASKECVQARFRHVPEDWGDEAVRPCLVSGHFGRGGCRLRRLESHRNTEPDRRLVGDDVDGAG